MKYILIFLILFSSFNVFAQNEQGINDIKNVYVNVSKKMLPSVVNIFTTARVHSPWRGEGKPDDLWRKFFEDFFGEPFNGAPEDQGPSSPKAMSLGSGFILEASNTGGLILTNNHVIDGADEIKIKFTESADEKESPAEVIGSDPDLDIALLKVKTRRKLEPVVLGDSDSLEVGEWVAAVGNPFGHGHSVTHGIVSAKERTLPGGFGKYLQVDAPINPGNSGGPLVNLNAEVVGINNAIDARGPGIGFAIPINSIKKVLDQLKSKGRVDRGYLGINIDQLQPNLAKSLKLDETIKAPIVTHVVPGAPADKAGIQAYDVILEVNSKTVHSPQELVGAVTNITVGEKAKLKILRGGTEKTIDVVISRRPDSRTALSSQRKSQGSKKKAGGPDVGMVLEQIDSAIAKELGLPPNYSGVVVARVSPSGPAFQAGLARGDVILEVERKPIKSVEQFEAAVKTKKTYLLRIRRQSEADQEVFAVVTLNLAETGEE